MAHSVSVLPALGCAPTLRASAADLHRSLLRLQLRNLQVRPGFPPSLSRPFAVRGSSPNHAASSHRLPLTLEPANRLSTASLKDYALAATSGTYLRTSTTDPGLCHFVV